MPTTAPRCALMNFAHGMHLPRSGAGSIPCSCRIRLIVFRPILYPRFCRAPLIRVYPHVSFSLAILSTSSTISPRFFGRPGPRRWLPSYFLATSSRYQRRIVSGEAIVATAARPFLPNFLPSVASRLRSAFVNRIRLPPSFSLGGGSPPSGNRPALAARGRARPPAKLPALQQQRERHTCLSFGHGRTKIRGSRRSQERRGREEALDITQLREGPVLAQDGRSAGRRWRSFSYPRNPCATG